ncbi:hypothetical protein [Winogradskyella sp.]|uniref:hypothetical protein n=1 Tax=Winogradskyella sp. TaxID=1883156 RepID=UPI002617B236|nr:hypothetical protein [Winogradskyella sp.]
MGKIHKHFWKWDDKMYDLSPYNLRSNIEELMENGLIIKSKDDSYAGANGFPWSINEKEGKVFSVFFNRDAFFPINDDKSVWNLEYKDFMQVMNQTTELVDKDYEGDKLYVVFRDFYVTISGIIAGSRSK